MYLRGILTVSIFILSLSGISFAAPKDTTIRIWVGKLNINTASEADFTTLPGIGNVIAHRIVQFRERIGGFKAVSELKRVRGINDHLFKRIEPNLSLFEKSDLKVLMDINSATMDALSRLPRLTAREANAIIEYRKRNEGFKKVEDLTLAGLSREQYEEIIGLVTVLPFSPFKQKP